MEPVMNDVETRKGNLVVGAMLVMVGLGIALERAGVIHWSGMWSLWPLILGGWGLAKFVQSPPGEPKEGLVLMTLAGWLLVSDAGWFALEDSWPLLVIAVGLIIAFNGGRRRWYGPVEAAQAAPPDLPGQLGQPWDRKAARRMRRHHRSMAPLAVLGIWIAIFVGFQMSGTHSIREFGESRTTSLRGFTESSPDRVRLVSVMGNSGHVSRATEFRGADVMNVMGRADLDLREATLAPGASASVQVFSMMGAVTLRVPPTWTVDPGAITAMGGVRDERFPRPSDTPEASTGPPPRLVLRGVVAMGRLSIR
jgi:hypothetical protein